MLYAVFCYFGRAHCMQTVYLIISVISVFIFKKKKKRKKRKKCLFYNYVVTLFETKYAAIQNVRYELVMFGSLLTL